MDKTPLFVVPASLQTEEDQPFQSAQTLQTTTLGALGNKGMPPSEDHDHPWPPGILGPQSSNPGVHKVETPVEVLVKNISLVWTHQLGPLGPTLSVALLCQTT